MKRVYEVKLQHKKWVNDYYTPWVVARTAAEAQRKSGKYVKRLGLPRTQVEVQHVKLLGDIDVE